MIELFDVNPFAEAMVYCYGRANNECIRKKLANMVKRFPTQKDEIEKAVRPVLELEKLLNSTLNFDEKLLNKYFGKFDGDESTIPHTIFDFCLASVMVGNPLINHLEGSLDSMCMYLHKCSIKERMYAFSFGLGNLREPFNKKNASIEKFSKQLEDMSFSIEDKWKIQSAAFNYRVHIDELLSLIIPTAKLIESASDIYITSVENFKSFYCDDKSKNDFNSYFNLKIKTVDNAKVAPMLFGFNRKFATLTFDIENAPNAEYSNPVLRTYLGIAYSIEMCSSSDESTELSESLKVISDKTRLDILFYLCSHKSYGQELCAKFNLSHSTISYHLTRLMNVGFVTGELSGSKTFYSANKTSIRRMADIFIEKTE